MTIQEGLLEGIRLATLLSLLAACGGGGGSSGSNTGELSLSLVGLPADAIAAVVVTGPGGYRVAATGSAKFVDLVPGSYTIAAGNALSGSSLYAPQLPTQTVDLRANESASAEVRYASAGTLHLGLEEVASGLSAPLFLTAPAGDPRLFIVERAGRIRIAQNGAVLGAPFLDIADRVSTAGEGGLLSMAFDPQYATNGFFYIYFTELSGDIAIERFRVSAGDTNLADPSPLRIITVTHRSFANHKGGLVAFGPDGFLYIGTGDGGGSGDPQGNAQNLDSLLGKLLRIDVGNAGSGQPYTVPALNPFASQAGRRAEIWGYGLRNPWRYAFDAPTDLVYVADVGQSRVEEVNARAIAEGGLNYGWNIVEGSLCYPSDPCDKQGLSMPVLEYGHDANGGCAVTGGHVYRGDAIPELRGRYFYSDFCGGWLRSFLHVEGGATENVDWNIANVGGIYSFGLDAQGEMYLLATTGKAHKIVRQ